MECPLAKENCSEKDCHWWIMLIIDKQEKGRCCIAWIRILLVEIRQSIDKRREEDDAR